MSRTHKDRIRELDASAGRMGRRLVALERNVTHLQDCARVLLAEPTQAQLDALADLWFPLQTPDLTPDEYRREQARDMIEDLR